MLSKEGKCKSFDASGNGYVRSEAAVAMFLQKANDARRIYATIIHADNNSDGYKDAGLSSYIRPSKALFLLSSFLLSSYLPITRRIIIII